MPMHGEERCFDGSKYRFAADGSGGALEGDPNSPITYLRQIIEMLQPVTEHYAWLGIITPIDARVPANAYKRRIAINPPARTIRIETNASIEMWLNDDSGVPIVMGGDRKVFTISDLPPAAAISAIIVSSVDEANLSIIGVA